MGALTQSFPTQADADSLQNDASRTEADILDEEPVSPELVLIDPVLAVRARAALPDRPEFPSVADAETVAQREIRAIGAEQLAAVDQHALHRRRSPRVGMAVVAAAVVAAGFAAAGDVKAPGAAATRTQMAMMLEETALPPYTAVLGSRHTLENGQRGTPVGAKATTRRSHASRPASRRRKTISGSRPSRLRPPAFHAPGAPKEPLDEIPLPARADRLNAWLTPSRGPTAANQRHWLYQHEWIITGARFGWWHGAAALRVLIRVDRRIESQWGIGYRSEALARNVLAALKARTE